jgi:hypothetical protein
MNSKIINVKIIESCNQMFQLAVLVGIGRHSSALTGAARCWENGAWARRLERRPF